MLEYPYSFGEVCHLVSNLSWFLHFFLSSWKSSSINIDIGQVNFAVTDGECLVAWASLNGVVPLYDPKNVANFHSGRWNTGTNPDLTFVSVVPDSPVPDKRILETFPRSQHRLSLIVPPNLLCLFRASLLSDGTSARTTGATTMH